MKTKSNVKAGTMDSVFISMALELTRTARRSCNRDGVVSPHQQPTWTRDRGSSDESAPIHSDFISRSTASTP
jgi:hypothetical protein